MRRCTALIIVLVFLCISSAGLSYYMIRLDKAGVWLSGTVSEIEKNPDNSLITLTSSKGLSITFSVTSDKLGGILVGDRITVREVKGGAADFKKTDMKMANTGPG